MRAGRARAAPPGPGRRASSGRGPSAWSKRPSCPCPCCLADKEPGEDVPEHGNDEQQEADGDERLQVQGLLRLAELVGDDAGHRVATGEDRLAEGRARGGEEEE